MRIDFNNNTLIITLYDDSNLWKLLKAVTEIERYLCKKLSLDFTQLKIEEAKKLLRENFSPAEIANQLYFESPTYFTKVFKKHTGTTPSAYKKHILK